MKQSKTMFVCKECKETVAKWLGRCPACGAWGTMQETEPAPVGEKKPRVATKAPELFCLDDLEFEKSRRHSTGFLEINRVLGGGLVEGGLALICGEPGMGKSTLLLQICNKVKLDGPIFYFSGEESARQIKLRADRLGVKNQNIFLVPNTDIVQIEATVREKSPKFVIVDSIQTTQCEQTAFSSSVSQIKEATVRLMHLAKEVNTTIFVVGHVNKEGSIAGPKVLEHIVDIVLYLEGERSSNYRILRTVKNRFGPTSEVAVLDMEEDGLTEILDPAALMLNDKPEPVAGSCVACVLEGTRALFLETQALVVKTGFAMPRRTASGLDYNRICVLIAVLEKHLGLKFGMLDAYVSVVGGFKLSDPSTDLAIALSLLSTIKDKPLPERTVAFGEIDLTGGVRSVASTKLRVSEAQRLKFKRCILPSVALQQLKPEEFKIELLGVKTVKELLRLF